MYVWLYIYAHLIPAVPLLEPIPPLTWSLNWAFLCNLQKWTYCLISVQRINFMRVGNWLHLPHTVHMTLLCCHGYTLAIPLPSHVMRRFPPFRGLPILVARIPITVYEPTSYKHHIAQHVISCDLICSISLTNGDQTPARLHNIGLALATGQVVFVCFTM